MAIVAALVACSTPAPTGPSPPPSPKTFALQTEPWGGGCPDIALVAVLHGAPADPHTTWINVFNLGHAGDGPQRYEVLWYPKGFTARFTPDLIVMDPEGKVVGREGDSVDGGCVVEAPGVGRNVIGIPATAIRSLGGDVTGEDGRTDSQQPAATRLQGGWRRRIEMTSTHMPSQ